ncbi:MAG: N-acetyl-gamma-glutamyl-phosphate reductase [Candidatus Eremiobacteraeota bacterium]|nr:N-acetyl-gamma-glutamyl-phosphate reductase [Candidatus Eremiobacteraeota bacterium]MCW5865844.1 N-acetyl-gamma-glutamyl-phosphate reductase [Candidatus Eremiobacteraeota bacterium]
MKERVAILGATGYSGRELVERLRRHSGIELVWAACRSELGKTLDQVQPGSPPQLLCSLDEVDFSQLDTVFLCLPHAASAEWGERALAAGCRVIDLSADYRLRSAELYKQVYGLEHPHPERLSQAVYGLTELHRPQLKRARLIANPGCYPTSVLLGLAPLKARGLLKGLVVADSKSGVSGAGRSATLANLHGEVAENLRPYAVGDKHRHRSEMFQELGGAADLLFVPQVAPCFRGMLSNLYVDLPEGDMHGLYAEFYAGEPFVKVLPPGEIASMAHTRQTNLCVISLHPMPEQGKLIVISSIDNLVKGAAGQALQNLNVARGWPETEGLL